MTREEAKAVLNSMTESESLLRHARTIELVMEAYAKELGQNENDWAIAGLLHDADYEKYPDKHPSIIVELLRERGLEDIAHAISAHYTKWGVSYDNDLDRYLLACDELTGFIVACCHVRPEGISTLTPKSVIKKLKQYSFAAKVERNEVNKGVELIGRELKDHIQFIIDVLKVNNGRIGYLNKMPTQGGRVGIFSIEVFYC